MSGTAKAPRSQAARDRILAAARTLFVEQGFDRTTIRAVAAAADIHASMVMRYYENKDGLFAAVMDFDLEIPDLSATPRDRLGETLVRHALWRWERNAAELPALLRLAVTHEGARERLLAVFSGQVAPALARVCPPQEIPTRAALVATQILGLALARYVLLLPPVVALPEAVLIERVGATLQAYLTA